MNRYREEQVVYDLKDWNLGSLTAYLVAKRDTCSMATVNTYHRGLKTVSRWLHRRGYLAEDYFQHLPSPKRSRKKPEPFTAEDIRMLAEAAMQRPYRLRTLAIMHLLLDTLFLSLVVAGFWRVV